MRIGLVLGAGGSVGVAYHGGVLAALEQVTGWDPRNADVIVGTSAGSLTAALLRAGLPASDLASNSENLPLSEDGTRIAAIGRPHRPRPKPAHLLHMRLVADPAGVVHALAHPGRHPLGALVAALMPSGPIPTEALSLGTDLVSAGSWPEKPMWLNAVSLRDGKRVVFGHGSSPQATVGQAVAASCAIPAYFRPVEIGGRRFVDGGVHSPTNLDLVAEAGFDMVIVSAPMSYEGAVPPVAAQGLVRASMRAHFHSELAALRRTGVPVVAIEPSRRVAVAMGLNPMDARRRGAVSRVTRVETTRWLQDRVEGRRLVAMLAVAAARGSGDAAGQRSAPPLAAEGAAIATSAFSDRTSA